MEAARHCRTGLIQRLYDEDEPTLAAKLEGCSDRFRLTCSFCGNLHEVEKGCGQKWCPVCVRKIAAKRAEKYRLAVNLMEWPLFITLTVPHTQDSPLTQLRRLRRGFGALRRHKLWAHRVRGGVAGLEINSRTGAFHPHLHAVVDCKWLAWYTRPPQRGDGKSIIKQKCIAASEELGLSWARCLKIKSLDPDWCGVIYKVKRTTAGDITSEILKYSVKGTDLLQSSEKIGPVIRALQSTRLVTSFGTLYGKARVDDGTEKPDRGCERCGKSAWITDYEIEPHVRSSRERRHGR